MNKQFIIFVLLLASLIHGTLYAQTKRIAVAYSAISATQSGFYLAKEAKIFDKHGLRTSIPFTWRADRCLRQLSLVNSRWPGRRKYRLR